MFMFTKHVILIRLQPDFFNLLYVHLYVHALIFWVIYIYIYQGLRVPYRWYARVVLNAQPVLGRMDMRFLDLKCILQPALTRTCSISLATYEQRYTTVSRSTILNFHGLISYKNRKKDKHRGVHGTYHRHGEQHTRISHYGLCRALVYNTRLSLAFSISNCWRWHTRVSVWTFSLSPVKELKLNKIFRPSLLNVH